MEFSTTGTKTVDEVEVWLSSVIEDSRKSNGIELFGLHHKEKSVFLGYCGLTLFPDLDGKTEIEIGYRLIRKHWGNGYACEAAFAVRDYAFTELKLQRLVALIEPTNIRSICVAKKIGMTYEKEVLLAEYDYPDHLYSMKNAAISA